MTRDDIRNRLLQNLRRKGIGEPEIRIQEDPYSGWRIVVIASGYEGQTQWERSRSTLEGLEGANVQSAEFLTPEEKRWAGSLPIDVERSDLPFWPEAIARGSSIGKVVFPSELDEDLPLPITATFFSLRGGVGRSTALAYTAYVLANRGRSVLCVDMDLEAPGLAALFGLGDAVTDEMGLVQLLVQLDHGDDPDVSKHILRVSESLELYCVPAGRPSANYARMLRFIDPPAYYTEERNPLQLLAEKLKNGLPFRPDVILFDARTGFNALSGPLLFDLSDLSIIVFFPHPQAREGTGALVRGLLGSHTWRRNGQPLSPEPRFVVSPVPASKIPEVIRRYEHRAIEWIDQWLEPVDSQWAERERIDEADITHFIPYRDVIATSDQVLEDEKAWDDYYPIAEWLEAFLPAPGEERIADATDELKDRALEQFEFPAGVAESQEHLLETFVRTSLVRKALQPDIPLVLGRKGTGKTALFRRLQEDEGHAVSVMAPAKLARERRFLGPDGLKAAERLLKEEGASWREFWSIYTCLACYTSSPDFQSVAEGEEQLKACLPGLQPSERDVVQSIARFLRINDHGLLTREWLRQLDDVAHASTYLLFDGLDTGFGNEAQDRSRRRSSIEGLFAFLLDREPQLRHLRFKILLREDIWRRLQFENKSHLFGRYVQLTWNTKADYYKVVVNHALRSSAFRQLAVNVGVLYHDSTGNVEVPRGLADEQVFELWNLLVGERMRGAKTAYTSNWVWNRLADGNRDRSPRTLLQLFKEAHAWERRQASRYDKSIIRPRALIESLNTVSEQAVSAIIDEEFSELKPLVERLREIGRTPVDRTLLSDDLKEEISLAREVGLLEVYEGTEEDVQRFKVPDIYRLGIGMTRKGQA